MKYEKMIESFKAFTQKEKKKSLNEMFVDQIPSDVSDERAMPAPDDASALGLFITSGEFGKAISDREFANIIKKAVSINSEVAEWDRGRVQDAYNQLARVNQDLDLPQDFNRFEDDEMGELSNVHPMTGERYDSSYGNRGAEKESEDEDDEKEWEDRSWERPW